MEIDLRAVRERFREMSREELLEEAALRAEEYIPAARAILEGDVRDRGITAAELEKVRRAGDEPAAEPIIDFPALLVSSQEKEPMRELAAALRKGGIPALVREMDQRGCGNRGPTIGRWGIVVPGAKTAEAGRLLESLLPPPEEELPADEGCGSGCSPCGDEAEPTGEEWPEDGDWWKTDTPEEDGKAR
jgi:hypothetical protein